MVEKTNIRLNYQGGNAEQRFQRDKLNTLKKALLYSYQAATATLSDGREFRCLINPNKLKPDYDNKIISIPYKDICLNSDKIGKTSEGLQEVGLKPGDVFKWKETDSYWIIYLQYIEEDAYFRAEIRKCEEEVEINKNKYHIYIRGPVETTIQWNLKKNKTWNDINYSLVLYITKNEDTLNFFHRFAKVKINGNTWEVKAVDPYSADGIIEVCLGEWYNNEMEETLSSEDVTPEINKEEVYIDGPMQLKPYDSAEYKIQNAEEGNWYIKDTKKVKIIKETDKSIEIEILTGKSGNFDILYYNKDGTVVELPIVIKSL